MLHENIIDIFNLFDYCLVKSHLTVLFPLLLRSQAVDMRNNCTKHIMPPYCIDQLSLKTWEIRDRSRGGGGGSILEVDQDIPPPSPFRETLRFHREGKTGKTVT